MAQEVMRDRERGRQAQSCSCLTFGMILRYFRALIPAYPEWPAHSSITRERERGVYDGIWMYTDVYGLQALTLLSHAHDSSTTAV